MQIEKLEDAVLPVSEIVKRCPAKQLMAIYKVPTFDDTDQFLQHIALVRGKLKKGGTVDVQAAAKVVLQDWNDGRIPFYTMPPQREAQDGHAAAEVVTHWASDFDADQVYSQSPAVQKWRLVTAQGHVSLRHATVLAFSVILACIYTHIACSS
jgi:nuclear GTP-binding protein